MKIGPWQNYQMAVFESFSASSHFLPFSLVICYQISKHEIFESSSTPEYIISSNTINFLPIHISFSFTKFIGWTLLAPFSFCTFRCYHLTSVTAVANAVFKTFLASEAGKPGPVAMDNSGFCYELYHFFKKIWHCLETL